MSKSCCASGCSADAVLDARFRKALWAALIVNACMFALEIVGGLTSGSVSLLADAVDFGGDAASYGISLAVLSMGLAWRSRAAMVKGLSMTAFGAFIIGKALWSALHGEAPEPLTMGVIGLLALLANTGVALMLYAFRSGDANMRSVWLCSRNDMLGNLAVMLAALGVFGTGSAWPDLLVALIMAGLALSSGLVVVRQARQELAAGTPLSGRGRTPEAQYGEAHGLAERLAGGDASADDRAPAARAVALPGPRPQGGQGTSHQGTADSRGGVHGG